MFEWKAEYAVGISEIDRQHQELFRMGSEIYDLVLDVSGEAPPEQVFSLVEALKGYAEEHFALEESLMERYEYPDLEEHRKAHEGFRSHVAEISKGGEDQSRTQMVTELIKFITQWVFKHICTEDAAYAPYLKSRLH